MLQSFYNSIAGIKSQQFGMDVTSNNIANVNTAGFKASTAEFKDTFAKALSDTGPTTDQIGLGSSPASTALNTAQGSLENTDREFDLAIAGDGWFNVSATGGSESYYTRAGNFSVNADGYLINQDGLYLMGINANNINNNVLNPDTVLDPQSATMQPLEIPTHLTYPSEPTTQVSMRKNLVFGSDYQKQSIGIVTPEGTKTNLVIEFTPSATQPGVGASWDYSSYVEDSGNPPVTGSLLFDSSGGMVNDTTISVDNDGTPIEFFLGGGFDGIISTTGEVNTGVVANGKPEGELTNYRVDQTGNIIASFNNSESAAIGKIPLYHFMNDQGLHKEGDNLFSVSSNSGEATRYIGDDGEFTMGSKINSHMLEYSNVDLSVSMTNLIVFQKAFNASSKGITTSDQMIQTAINMKK